MSELGQKIIAEVRKVAAENPNHIYSRVKSAKASCVYIDNGAPSCIVGHALWNVGLIDADWRGDDPGISSSIRNVIEHEGWNVNDSEMIWLGIVQDAQDQGISWGTSVKLADKGGMYEDV